MDSQGNKIITFSFYAEKDDLVDTKEKLTKEAQSKYYSNLLDAIKKEQEAIRKELKKSNLNGNGASQKSAAKICPKDIPPRFAQHHYLGFLQKCDDLKSDRDSRRINRTEDIRIAENLQRIDKLWRPSIALALAMREHKNGGKIDEYHLLFQPGHSDLQHRKYVEWIKADIERLSPGTYVCLDEINIGGGHDFQDIYCALLDYFESYKKETGGFDSKARYFVNVTSGSQATRMCLFLMAQERWIPAETIQLSRSNPNLGDKSCPSAQQNTGYCVIAQAMVDSGEFRRQREDLIKESADNQSILKQHITTRDPTYNRMIEEIEKISLLSDDPLLILGPTGAGKSHLAEQIHNLKKKKSLITGKFVSLNCATLAGSDENMTMSALFGQAKGAYTGAMDRKGAIENADKGTLFLDEIGCLPLDTQKMLLTALDKKKFQKLGEDNEKDSDFKLICATNDDLVSKVNAGLFRSDLFERIRMWTFRLPGLGERKDDISPNIDAELKKFVEHQQSRNKNVNNIILEGQPREKFLAYAKSIPLSGNFRELHRMVWRMATLAHGPQITMDVVDAEIERHKTETRPQEQEHEDKPIPDTSATPKDTSTNSQDVSDVLRKLLGNDYKTKFDPLDLIQLEYVVKACRSARNAAELGRALRPGGNGNVTLNNFLKRDFIKDANLTFSAIKSAWNDA